MGKKRDDSLYQRIGIYGIVNTINDKVYVGKTIANFGTRRDCHFALLRHNKHYNTELQNDFNILGEKYFDFIVLEDCDQTAIKERETAYIQQYKKANIAYNVTDGDGLKGCHLSEKAKALIGAQNREHMLGKTFSEETKEKHRKLMQGKHLSEEAKEKLRKSHTGRKASEETKEKLRKVNQTKSAKVNAEQVRAIRALKANGASTKDLATQYHLSVSAIRDICNRKHWANIE